MKRILISLGCLAILIPAVAIALPFFVSSASFHEAVRSQLRSLTGHEVQYRGDLALKLSPFLSVEIEDLVVGNQTVPGIVPLLQVERVKARIDFFQSLFGKIHFNEFFLESPRLNLTREGSGKANWEITDGPLKRALNELKNQSADEAGKPVTINPRIGKFTVIDGAIRFEDAMYGRQMSFTALEGVLDWQAANDGADVSGSAIWLGENFSFDLSLDQPLRLVAGRESGVNIAVESTPLNLKFDGDVNRLADLFFKGDIEFSTPSTTRLSELLGTRMGKLGSLEISAEMEASASQIRLTDANVAIAGNSSEGFLNVAKDDNGNSKISGTLAFDDLDFSRILGSDSDDVSTEEIRDQAGITDVDLRLSATSVNAGFMELHNVGAIVSADANGWSLNIGQSNGFGGNLIGKFGERYDGNTRLGYLEANGSSVDTGELSALFSGHKIRFSGLADLFVSVRGSNILEILQRSYIDGKLEATFLDGAIEGIDLPQLLVDSGKEQFQVTGTKPGQRTGFDRAHATIVFTDSIGTIGRSEIISGDTRIQLSGSFGLKEGSLSLRAQEISDSGPLPERLFIGGTLNAPLISVKPVSSRHGTSVPQLRRTSVEN